MVDEWTGRAAGTPAGSGSAWPRGRRGTRARLGGAGKGPGGPC